MCSMTFHSTPEAATSSSRGTGTIQAPAVVSQSNAVVRKDDNPLISLAPRVGIAPTTNGLTGRIRWGRLNRTVRNQRHSERSARQNTPQYTPVRSAGNQVGNIRGLAGVGGKGLLARRACARCGRIDSHQTWCLGDSVAWPVASPVARDYVLRAPSAQASANLKARQNLLSGGSLEYVVICARRQSCQNVARAVPYRQHQNVAGSRFGPGSYLTTEV